MLLGLTLGGVLLTHAGLQIARAFPPEVRASAVDAVKRRPRLAVVTLAVMVWTFVYALYSLAYPSGAAFFSAPRDTATVESTSAEEPVLADNRELLAPSIGGELALPPDASFTVTPDTTPSSSPPTTTAPAGDAPPTTTATTAPPPPAVPCPFDAVADAFGPQAAEVLCPEGNAP